MHSGGGCRVGEVQAGTTSPMPDHKGFKLPKLVNFQKFSTLRVKSSALFELCVVRTSSVCTCAGQTSHSILLNREMRLFKCEFLYQGRSVASTDPWILSMLFVFGPPGIMWIQDL